MKDYLVYQMMDKFDAATPLCSYVYISVNGEDHGLYLAVESVEDSLHSGIAWTLDHMGLVHIGEDDKSCDCFL